MLPVLAVGLTAIVAALPRRAGAVAGGVGAGSAGPVQFAALGAMYVEASTRRRCRRRGGRPRRRCGGVGAAVADQGPRDARVGALTARARARRRGADPGARDGLRAHAAMDPHSARARFTMITRGGPAPPVTLALAGPGYRAGGRVSGGYEDNSEVSVAVAPPPHALLVRACLRNDGRATVRLAASGDRTRSRSLATVDGHRTSLSPWLTFDEARPTASSPACPMSLQRMSTFRPGVVGPWLLSPLALLVLLGVPAGVVWAYSRALAEDAVEPAANAPRPRSGATCRGRAKRSPPRRSGRGRHGDGLGEAAVGDEALRVGVEVDARHAERDRRTSAARGRSTRAGRRGCASISARRVAASAVRRLTWRAVWAPTLMPGRCGEARDRVGVGGHRRRRAHARPAAQLLDDCRDRRRCLGLQPRVQVAARGTALRRRARGPRAALAAAGELEDGAARRPRAGRAAARPRPTRSRAGGRRGRSGTKSVAGRPRADQRGRGDLEHVGVRVVEGEGDRAVGQVAGVEAVGELVERQRHGLALEDVELLGEARGVDAEAERVGVARRATRW